MSEAYLRVAKAIADNMSELTASEIKGFSDNLLSDQRPELPYLNFPVTIKCMSVGWLIKNAKIKSVDSACLKKTNRHTKEFDEVIHLMSFDHAVNPRWVIEEVNKRGYRPVDMVEMLFLMSEVRLPGLYIASLGSMHSDQDGYYYLPVFFEYGGNRRLYEECMSRDCGLDWRFAVVKK